MRCVKYLMFQSWLNKKTFTSISLGIWRTYHSAEILMWLRSLDCFMQKGQDESVDSAETISVPCGLRRKKHCCAARECYFDIQIIQVQYWFKDTLVRQCFLFVSWSWCLHHGKVFKNGLWRKPGSPQPLNKPLYISFEVPCSLGWRAAFTLGNFWNHWDILRSLCHVIIWLRTTMNYGWDEDPYSKLGACRYHLVVCLILLHMSIHTTQVCIYGNIMEHTYIYIYTYVHAVYKHDFDL